MTPPRDDMESSALVGDWESIDDQTRRLRVPGGWIYRVEYGLGTADNQGVLAMCFVPDADEGASS